MEEQLFQRRVNRPTDSRAFSPRGRSCVRHLKTVQQQEREGHDFQSFPPTPERLRL